MEQASCTLPFTAIRKKPDEGAEQMTQALFADPLDVVASEDGWAQVTAADGLGGWIRSDALGEPLQKDRAHVVVVPQAADRYLGTWLVAPGLRTEPLAAARRKAGGDAIAETALMFLGAPYEWGGVTVHGLDCSGLVQAVHRRFGLLLPHNAEQQERAGREVSLRQVQPGDLVCYGDHIAIWAGEGKIVHAAKEAGKVVEEAHPAELKNRVRTVRRVYEAED
ncbi:MAG TPA: C40 family peptidase [Gaiellales bacterium]|nr:C40 family peptidase [Gaiellales bacterium]